MISEVIPVEEIVKRIMIEFRHRRMAHIVGDPASVTDEKQMPEEIRRHAEASAIVQAVLADACPAPHRDVREECARLCDASAEDADKSAEQFNSARKWEAAVRQEARAIEARYLAAAIRSASKGSGR